MSLISHCEFAQRENQNIANFLNPTFHVFSQLIVKCFFGPIQVEIGSRVWSLCLMTNSNLKVCIS